MLASTNFEVSEAAEAGVALNFCRSTMPALIMLDWHMPGLSPHGFLTSLRAMPFGRRPHVLYCPTMNDVENITHHLKSGADSYLVKPFTRQELMAKLTSVGLLYDAPGASRQLAHQGA